jgi:hypothetical protein
MYFLPKIHKPDNLGRPIVSACGCPTELISSLLDCVKLAPLVKDLPSYIRNIKHALQILRNIFIFMALTNSFSPQTSNPYTL